MQRFFTPLFVSAIILTSCNEAVTKSSITKDVSITKKEEEQAPVEEVIATVDCITSGCFSSEMAHLQLKRIDKAVFAELNVNDTGKIVVELSELQLAKFETFIKELNSLSGLGVGTTTSQYRVVYKGETIKKTDAGFKWNGFVELKKALFTNK